MQHDDVDMRRRSYRYRPQPDPAMTAYLVAFRAGLEHPDVVKTEKEDATIGNEDVLRGIPAVGRIGGAINGTRPGDDATRAARDDLYVNARDALKNTHEFIAYLLSRMTEDEAVDHLARTYGMKRRNLRLALRKVHDMGSITLTTIPPRGRAKHRLRVLNRDKWTCHICACHLTAANAHVDHLVPRSQGGTDDYENLAASCATCNTRRGNRPIPTSSRYRDNPPDKM